MQVAKFIPRGVILQYLGAQREIYIEPPAAAALVQYMPKPKPSESSRVVKSPMTGTLVEVGGQTCKQAAAAAAWHSLTLDVCNGTCHAHFGNSRLRCVYVCVFLKCVSICPLPGAERAAALRQILQSRL